MPDGDNAREPQRLRGHPGRRGRDGRASAASIPTPAGAGLPGCSSSTSWSCGRRRTAPSALKVRARTSPSASSASTRQAITTLDLQANVERMCVLPGDYVALATSGGYDPQSYPAGRARADVQPRPDLELRRLQEGRDRPSSSWTGTTARPTTTADKELLMRITIGTGDDARPTCRVATTTARARPPARARPARRPRRPTARAVSIKAPAKARAGPQGQGPAHHRLRRAGRRAPAPSRCRG